MVVRVPLLADETGLAACRTRVVLATALPVNLDRAAGASGVARVRAGVRARAGGRSSGSSSGGGLGGGNEGGGSGRCVDRGLLGGSRGHGHSGGSRSSRARAGGAGRARGRAIPDSRARDGVAGEGVVHVEENTWVGGLVGTGNGNTGREGLGAGRGDLDLDTLHVELGATLAVTLVQGDDLRTEQVLAGRDIGNGDRVLAPVGDQVCNRPFAVRVALLSDLDPAVASCSLLGGSHVDHHGTHVGGSDDVVGVRASVVVPLEGNLVAGLDGEGLSNGVLAVDVASHVGRGDIGDGAVVGGRTNVSVSGVSRTLVHVVDPDGVDSRVGADELSCCCQSEQSEGRLHFERRFEL